MRSETMSSSDVTPPVGGDDRRGRHDERPDFGIFGRTVTALIVVLIVTAIAVAVLVEPLVWALAALLLAALVLWTRLTH
jgi:Flp pilus assembly protein TadB